MSPLMYCQLQNEKTMGFWLSLELGRGGGRRRFLTSYHSSKLSRGKNNWHYKKQKQSTVFSFRSLRWIDFCFFFFFIVNTSNDRALS